MDSVGGERVGRCGRMALKHKKRKKNKKRTRWVLGGAEFWSVSVGSKFMFVTLIFKASTHTFV